MKEPDSRKRDSKKPDSKKPDSKKPDSKAHDPAKPDFTKDDLTKYDPTKGDFMQLDPTRLDWDKVQGLLPAIVQDAHSGAVLMLGYMDREALAQTQRSGRVTFFSRSRQRLWTKGESSGNFLTLRAIHADCDNDTLLVLAEPAGPTCHLGTQSCFDDAATPSLAFLGELEALIAQRDRDRPEGSYTTKLFDEGVRRIAQKVGEEGVETALAAVAQDEEATRGEVADLLFHVLVLLRARGIGFADVIDELRRRHAPAS